MQNSVLTLGEKIVLAARLASIEHVRQELDAARRLDVQRQEASDRAVRSVGDRSLGVTEDPEPVAFTRPVPVVLREVFRRLEKTTQMPARPRARGAA